MNKISFNSVQLSLIREALIDLEFDTKHTIRQFKREGLTTEKLQEKLKILNESIKQVEQCLIKMGKMSKTTY